MTKKLVSFALLVLCLFAFSSEQANAAGNDVIRLGIMPFYPKASKVSEDLVNFIPDVFTRMLAESPSIAVIERESLEAVAREQKLSLSGLIDVRTAVKIGHLAGCQYMLLGAVTNYSSTLENQFVLLSATSKKEITIDIRLVDVNTGEVTLAMSETGTSERDSGLLNIVSGTLKGGGNEEAVEGAVSKLGSKIREVVAGEYMQVLKAGGKKVTVSIGRTSGAKKGAYYKVFAEGSEILDMNGRSLGREVSNIAVVQIDDVQNQFSGAKVTAGKPENIRRGDKIELISASEAKRILKDKDYLNKRPRAGTDISSLFSQQAK